jgi:hypothetical protein
LEINVFSDKLLEKSGIAVEGIFKKTRDNSKNKIGYVKLMG